MKDQEEGITPGWSALFCCRRFLWIVVFGAINGLMAQSILAFFVFALLLYSLVLFQNAVGEWNARRDCKSAAILFLCSVLLGLSSLALWRLDVPLRDAHTKHAAASLTPRSAVDTIVRVDVSLPLGCCGYSTGSVYQSNCAVEVDIQYCRTIIVNGVSTGFCYMVREQRAGTYDAVNNFCCVALPELGGRVVCVRPGTIVTLGPVMQAYAPAG